MAAVDMKRERIPTPVCTPRALASRRALGRFTEGGREIPRLRARGTDSHTSDVGHWFGMTGQEQSAGTADRA